MLVRRISFFLRDRHSRNIILPALLLISFVTLFTETAQGAGQLLCNPGFEDSTANGTFPDSGCWKPSSAGGGAYAVVTTTAARSGNNGLWIYTGNESWAYWSRPYQQFSAAPGQTYSGSAWIRTPSGEDWVDGSLASARIEFLNDIGSILAAKSSSGVTTTNSGWAQYSLTSDPAPTGTVYVRFICNIEKPSGVSGISVANFDDTFFELSVDNQPPNTPSNPSPSDGSTGVSITPTLSWSGGDPDAGDTITYDVYFGTSSSPPKVLSDQDSTSHSPGTIAHSTIYYWKIVARDNHGAETTGTIWSFTTSDNTSVVLAYEHLYEVMDKYHDSFDVYTDQDAGGNHFYPSGWMGDIASISFDSDWTSNCYSGTSCIKITFTANDSNWAGIYWQEPENNWGTEPDVGYDIRGAAKITFWARGENGGERVEFFVGGIPGSYPDSLEKTSTGYITLTNSWQEYTIDLTSKDLSHVIGGFGWVANSPNNPDGATFYLDEIRYDKSRADELRFLVSFETLSLIDPDRYIRNASFIYDNALALLSLLARGNNDDLRRAKLLADAFVYAQNNDRYYADGRLRNAYMSGDLIDHLTGKARIPGWWDPEEEEWYEDEFQVSTHTGNLAWVMIALLNYYEKIGAVQYLEAAIDLAEWIETETRDTVSAGGYSGGYEGWEPEPQKITWKSTEHNIDIYVAFMLLYEITGDEKWKERALHAKNFVAAMWNETENHFWTGTLDDGVTINESNIPVDIQAWAIMAMNSYNSALSWAEDNSYTEHDGFKGFDFNNDRDGVWFEGTAQMAVAYQMNGETNKSDIYVAELQNAQVYANNANGKGIVAASHDGLTTGFDWEYFSRLHVGATAWYIFAETNYNPYWGTTTISDELPGNFVTTNLWIRAVINTVEKGPVEAIWKKGGEDTTSRGDRVIWGHFYASPSDVTWGSQDNPDLFVKIWFDVSGRVDVNYFHVSVPDIKVYSDYPYNGSPDEQGTTTMSRRYIRQYYENGQSYSDENYEDGNPPAGYSPIGNPFGYSTINDLRIGSIINTVEKGPIDALWRLGGQDTTARGDQVVWGHFYASPSDVTWGSQNNPDLFVKIWFDVSGRTDVNFFHVSVPDIEVYSDLPSDGTYDQQGTTIMDNRYIRHEYWR